MERSPETNTKTESSQFCLSTAIPVFNEENALPELLTWVCAVLDQIPGGPHEILFINDGSSDRSMEVIEEASHNEFLPFPLSRNFGHQAALSAALDHVTGDVVVLMDADLQDSPESIPILDAARLGFTSLRPSRCAFVRYAPQLIQLLGKQLYGSCGGRDRRPR